eukprot:g36534.t1
MLLHLEGVFGSLDTEEGGSKRAGVTPSVVAEEGAKGVMLGMKDEWTRESWRKQSLRKADEGGEGNLFLVEVVEVAANDTLNVDASGMGLVLGTLLFVIYKSDSDKNIGGMVSKFVDDTKVGHIVDNEG